jgi:hypothetical protein
LVDNTFSHGEVGLYDDQPNTTTGSGSGAPTTFSNFSLQGTVGACTVANLTGAMGFRATGAIITSTNPVPTAAVGLASFNGTGQVSGILTVSINGQISRGVTFSGSYSVLDANKCIFTTKTNLLNLGLVLVNGGELFGVDLDQGRTLSFDFLPQTSVNCSASLLNGPYGLVLDGDRIGGNNPGPRAGAAWYTFDGSGNFSGVEAQRKNGVIVSGSGTGTYGVNANCTGSGTLTSAANDVSRSFDMVVMGGDTVFGIATDAGRVTTFRLNFQ